MYETVLHDAAELALAYALVAFAAVPIAIVCGRRTTVRVQSGFVISTPEVLAFALFGLAMPELIRSFLAPHFESKTALVGVSHGVAATIWLSLIAAWMRTTKQPFAPLSNLPAEIRQGIAAFLLLTPIVYGVFFAVTLLMVFFGDTPEEHPLAKVDLSNSLGITLFIISACIGAPILEETIFRGFLFPWARRRTWRAWAVFAIAPLLLIAGKGFGHYGMLAFLTDLITLMALAAFGREVWKKWPSRTAASVVATSAAFAALHVAVWPTPMPLFVLGLGLGILTFRTHSVKPAIIAHALFNLVSVIFVLRRLP